MFRIVLAFCLAIAGGRALANDTTAELSTGGLILTRSDVIEMRSEELFISPERITVDYVFHNVSNRPVDTIVAFPMPDIAGSPYEIPAMPEYQSDNFLGFEVTVDGARVEPQLDHRAVAAGIDITDELRTRGVPLFPYADGAVAALAQLPQAVADDWQSRGILIIDEYDDGSGWKKVRTPFWGLRSTYWWRASFPAGRDVEVAHRYRPSLGGTSGLNFFSEGKLQGPGYEDYKARYCLDETIERAVMKAARANTDGYPQMYEQRLSYILRTGGNWATGRIGKFKLTIDKGDPAALVSFCGTGVRKTGPTTFEMTAEDFYPEKDLHVLILKSFEEQRAGEAAQDPEPRPAGNGG